MVLSEGSEMTTNDFKVGQRVQTHPATDAWMRGCRFGTVAALGSKYVYVKLDVALPGCRNPFGFRADNLLDAEG